MRYATVYYTSVHGYSQPKFHANKRDALKYFKWAIPALFTSYRKNDIPKDAPCSYGFPHRKLMCMSIRDYNKITKGATDGRIKLKRCPFCGGKATAHVWSTHTVEIMCKCGASFHFAEGDDFDKTVAAWNRRAGKEER